MAWSTGFLVYKSLFPLRLQRFFSLELFSHHAHEIGVHTNVQERFLVFLGKIIGRRDIGVSVRWIHCSRTCCPVFGVWHPVTAFASGCSNIFSQVNIWRLEVNPRAGARSLYLTGKHPFWPSKSLFISGRDWDLLWPRNEEGDSCISTFSRLDMHQLLDKMRTLNGRMFCWDHRIIEWLALERTSGDHVVQPTKMSSRCQIWEGFKTLSQHICLLANVKSFPLSVIILENLTLKFLSSSYFA